MRAKLKRSEARKALALVERVGFAMGTFKVRKAYSKFPEFIGMGAFNAVYGLTADLVVRVCRGTVPDESWAYYDWVLENGRLFEACPKVWQLGSFGGHRFAIVERMAHSVLYINEPVDRGHLDGMLDYLREGGYFCDDLHNGNIMLSRRGRVVCTDMHMYPPEHC